ncbi:Rz-like lysis system protein LysB [Paraburkholderia fungorum]|uniref:Protein lysB n=1 Tax=Paraburkholderia fungorum TaxID=134537 RepID=A0A3R7II98_9BURK|nr:Rz-like lysis system protein LysB [Paraburkholderia fungorum]RKF33391.1 protein lysB [Paraburkholderia fungorum]
MNALAAKCIAGVVVLLALVVGVLYVRELRAELADTAHQLETSQQDVTDRDGTIRRLQQDAADKARQQAQLDRTQGAIATTLSATQQENRRLLDENAALRAWSDTRLPDDVIRMHTSPALTGADDYIAGMPDGDALHIPGDGTQH